MSEVIVIGAGVGGLSAAITLAAAGRRVQVLEALDRPGGKAGVVAVDGAHFDTGPSVLTMPDVFQALLQLAGMKLADHAPLRSPSPAFQYTWADGATLDILPSLEATLARVAQTFGAKAERQFASYLAYAKGLWERGAERFVRGPAPGAHLLLSPGNLLTLASLDPFKTLSATIDARVQEPHLRALLMRYATYNGSDPRRTPATLGCIAHVELALGGFGVEGGIGALVDALALAAERLGVQIRCGMPVRALAVEHGRVVGVDTDAGHIAAEAVVANADAATVFGGLIDRPAQPLERSTSGWTCVVRAKRRPRVAHAVLFPADYDAEFVDLFDRRAPPADPTVYACAQRVAHGRAGWADAEPVFLMANAPAEGDEPTDPAVWARLRGAVLGKAIAAGLVDADDPVVWERTATDLAASFPGTRGAIYGPASHGPWSAFRRLANRSSIPGLYLASGSAHPGGGLPLCALSGRMAASAVLEDR